VGCDLGKCQRVCAGLIRIPLCINAAGAENLKDQIEIEVDDSGTALHCCPRDIFLTTGFKHPRDGRQ